MKPLICRGCEADGVSLVWSLESEVEGRESPRDLISDKRVEIPALGNDSQTGTAGHDDYSTQHGACRV